MFQAVRYLGRAKSGTRSRISKNGGRKSRGDWGTPPVPLNYLRSFSSEGLEQARGKCSRRLVGYFVVGGNMGIDLGARLMAVPMWLILSFVLFVRARVQRNLPKAEQMVRSTRRNFAFLCRLMIWTTFKYS